MQVVGKCKPKIKITVSKRYLEPFVKDELLKPYPIYRKA